MSYLDPAHPAPARATGLVGLAALTLVMFVPGHLYSWALEWAWLGVQAGFALAWFLLFGRPLAPTLGWSPRVWTVICVVLSLSGFWASFYSTAVLGMEVSPADIPDLLRYLVCLPLLLFVGSAVNRTTVEWMGPVLRAVVILNLACAAILIMDIPGAAEAVLAVYRDAKIQYEFGYLRIGIPFTNPNFAALVFLLLLAYFTFYERSPMFFGLTLASIFVTGSRSGMVAALPIILAGYYLVWRQALKNIRIFIVFAIFHVALVTIISSALVAVEDYARVLELLEAAQSKNIGQVDTAAIRVDLIRDAMGYIERSPVFGVGPARTYGLEITDSQLVAWPLIYGIPMALLLYAVHARLFLASLRRTGRIEYRLGAVASCAAFFLMLSTGDFMKNYRLFFIALIYAQCIYVLVQYDGATGPAATDGKLLPD